jgi:hypothetical protein
MPKPRLLHTASSAATATGLPRSALQRAIALGEIKTVLFAGKDRIPAREIERLKRLAETEDRVPNQPGVPQGRARTASRS